MSAHPGWRLGIDADCGTEACRKQIAENPGYAPYRLRTDFDGDSITDVVVVLVKGDSGTVFAVRGSGTAGPPQQLGVVGWAREAGLFADSAGVVFGKPFSDEMFSWRWSAAGSRLELIER